MTIESQLADLSAERYQVIADESDRLLPKYCYYEQARLLNRKGAPIMPGIPIADLLPNRLISEVDDYHIRGTFLMAPNRWHHAGPRNKAEMSNGEVKSPGLVFQVYARLRNNPGLWLVAFRIATEASIERGL
jgi:hypothetical protein